MFFYIIRLNVIPIDNVSNKRLYKIGITEDLPRRLEDHKSGLVGGYEIVNIIEHDYELMTLENNFKSKHLPYHGREIFLLDEQDLNFVSIGSIITESVLHKMRPGLCNICNKPAQSILFHKCKKRTIDVGKSTSIKPNTDVTKISDTPLTGLLRDITKSTVMDKDSYLLLSQEALKLGIINLAIYELIRQHTHA